MKKIILIIAGALCLSAAAVQAQDPATKDTTSTQQSENYRQDMVKIQATEIPAPLQTTLQAPEYKGWESAAIYRSKNSDMFVVEMKDAENKVTAHKFDANGKPIKE